ncbi:MAG: hypothetical protein U1F41_13785 [Burkholderiales bacterium]
MKALRGAIGVAAIVAPALHVLTDAMEWWQGGFTPAQLWLNYAAFIPMAWLLLGFCAVRSPPLGTLALAGAILYGAAFTYFAFTTLYALVERIADYATLWSRLGGVYTVHGALMVAGGAMFAWDAWRSRALPRLAVALFAAGLAVNLALALLPAPDMLQTAGSALRNAGLVAMGWALIARTASAA